MLKKVGIGCGALVAILGIAGAVFYFGWMVPPDAEEVCDNVARLTAQEAGVDVSTLPATLHAECVQGATTRPQYGLLPWVQRLKCTRDAATMDELRAGEGR